MPAGNKIEIVEARRFSFFTLGLGLNDQDLPQILSAKFMESSS